MCTYIYIYIYIYGCVGGRLWVLWVASEIIFDIFEAASECREDHPLSILAQRPHKELCLCEPARPKKNEGR